MFQNFVEENSESIDLLNKKVAIVIDSLKIDTSDILNVGKCVKITGEINKAIRNIKTLTKAISEVEPSDKVGILLAVTLKTLNSDEVKNKLSEEQRRQIEEFCQDTETVETVIGLVDWVADEILEGLDTNEDGVVTDIELENVCLKSCSCCCCQPGECCSGFAKFIAKFLCCGKKSVKYNNKKPVATNDVDVDV